MKLSIIIPVYNAEKYIKRCIDSIENSDYNDYEIVVIDDGSTDSSLEIIEQLKGKYSNIRIINQENHGVAFTRNRGIREAKGEYILFIDNDDYIDRNYLKRLVSIAEKDNCDIVIEGYERRNVENKLIERVKLKNCSWAKYQLTAPWGRIFKTSFLIDNHIEFLNSKVGEDAYFNMTAISKTNSINISDKCGYIWFYNDKSVSSTVQRHPMEDTYILLNNILKIFKDSEGGLDEEREYFLIKYACWYLFYINEKRVNSSEEIRRETDRIFSWLNLNIHKYKRNRNISLLRPYGEKLKIRASVFLLIKCRSLGIENKLLKVMSFL